MRRSLSSEASAVITTPTSDDAPATGVSSPGSAGMTTGVGKAASALLAKHVRTLEVLHSLQRENARLRLEIQVNNTTDPCNRVAMHVRSLDTWWALSGARIYSLSVYDPAPIARRCLVSSRFFVEESQRNSVAGSLQLVVVLLLVPLAPEHGYEYGTGGILLLQQDGVLPQMVIPTYTTRAHVYLVPGT